MDDMRLVANRFAEVAKDMINKSADVAQDVFDKTNPKDTQEQATAGSFTAAEAVASMAKLVDIAVSGSIAMARIPLQTKPDRNLLLATDHVASVVGRGAGQAARIVTDAAKDIEKDGFKKDRWAESAARLANIAMLRGAEIVQTIAAGPGMYRDPSLTSDEYTVDLDNDHDRLLTLTKAARPGIEENIAHQVGFVPSDRVLRKGHNKFQLTANSAGLPSGVYLCQIDISHFDKRDPSRVEVLFAL